MLLPERSKVIAPPMTPPKLPPPVEVNLAAPALVMRVPVPGSELLMLARFLKAWF